MKKLRKNCGYVSVRSLAAPAKTTTQTKKIMFPARYVVENEKDIKKCMELLSESDNVIKIQDILPFFPDFVTIDHFKVRLYS